MNNKHTVEYHTVCIIAMYSIFVRKYLRTRYTYVRNTEVSYFRKHGRKYFRTLSTLLRSYFRKYFRTLSTLLRSYFRKYFRTKVQYNYYYCKTTYLPYFESTFVHTKIPCLGEGISFRKYFRKVLSKVHTTYEST